MNETIIQNWNSIVRDTDEVFCLGDFALCSKDKIIEFGRRLRGRKHLVLGNHEGASLQTYKTAGFEYIYKYPIYIPEENVILSHYPIDSVSIRNIHGHTHGNRENDIFHFDVSVEKINYTPKLLEEILVELKNTYSHHEKSTL